MLTSDRQDAVPEYEARATDRLLLFSDAVVAIAITLLALELPVPTGSKVSAFWRSARQEDGHYLAFLISFLVISAAWSHHHDVFRYVRRVDPPLRQLNMGWLLMIILTPFATRLLTSSGEPVPSIGTHALRFGFYALLEVLTSGLLLAMVHRMRSHGMLEAAASADVTDVDWQSYGIMLGFGLSIPVFFATENAWVLWVLMPLLFGQIHRVQRRRHRALRAPVDKPPSRLACRTAENPVARSLQHHQQLKPIARSCSRPLSVMSAGRQAGTHCQSTRKPSIPPSERVRCRSGPP